MGATSTCVSGGRSGVIRAIASWTRCSATCMSVPHSKFAESSVDPREVVERTSRIPGSGSSACSSGRVTLGIMRAAGSWPDVGDDLDDRKGDRGKDRQRHAGHDEPAGDGEQPHDHHDREGAVVRPVEQAHGRAATAAPSGRPTWPADDDRLSGRELRRGDLRSGGAAQPRRHVDPVGLAAVDEGDPGGAREVVAHERRVGNHDGVAVLGDGDARRSEEAEGRHAGESAQVHADRDGEVGRVGAGQDVVDGSARSASVRPAHLDRDGLAGADPREVALGHVDEEHDGARVGDRRGSPARRTGGRRARRRARGRCRPRARSSGARTRPRSASSRARAASARSASVFASRSIWRAPASAASLSRETIVPRMSPRWIAVAVRDRELGERAGKRRADLLLRERGRPARAGDDVGEGRPRSLGDLDGDRGRREDRRAGASAAGSARQAASVRASRTTGVSSRRAPAQGDGIGHAVARDRLAAANGGFHARRNARRGPRGRWPRRPGIGSARRGRSRARREPRARGSRSACRGGRAPSAPSPSARRASRRSTSRARRDCCSAEVGLRDAGPRRAGVPDVPDEPEGEGVPGVAPEAVPELGAVRMGRVVGPEARVAAGRPGAGAVSACAMMVSASAERADASADADFRSVLPGAAGSPARGASGRGRGTSSRAPVGSRPISSFSDRRASSRRCSAVGERRLLERRRGPPS